MAAQEVKCAEELIATAKYIATPSKGVLAADESTGTIGMRLASVHVENVESNGQALCEMLFTALGVLHYLNGVILCEETVYQRTSSGKPFVEVLKEGGVVPGIKVDKGVVDLASTDGETTTQGLDGLAYQCHQYCNAGLTRRDILNKSSIEDVDIVIHTNLNGVIYPLHEALPFLKEQVTLSL